MTMAGAVWPTIAPSLVRRRTPALVGVGFWVLAILLAEPLRADFFEPAADYYRAQGYRIEVRWHIPHPTVAVGSDLLAVLIITGAHNPLEVQKPDLTKLSAFHDFIVTNADDRPRTARDTEIRFHYKLQPRHSRVQHVPALEFYYRSLAAPPESNPFRLTRAYSVPITVTAPPPPVPIPMTEADHLFHITSGEAVLRSPMVPDGWAWLAVAVFGPVAAAGWYLLWRWLYPDAAQMARQRRSRAARRALEALEKAEQHPEPAAAIAAALLGYLRARFVLPENAVTPSEVHAALLACAVPAELAEQAAEVFRLCDEARFAPQRPPGTTPAAAAQAVLLRLETVAAPG
ncbi:MAG: hypothetical protein RMJ56_12630 [Gemmataceae bacterium]|nr:hypothetical protein [Gemmata sp.]MDW8198439.1 hypothetical protein [Gemmataceae bacterium]